MRNGLDNSGLTPLHVAAFRGDDAVAWLEPQLFQDVSTIHNHPFGGGGVRNHPQCSMGAIFLQTVERFVRRQVVQALCQLGANVKAVDEEGWTPLYVPWRNRTEVNRPG